MTDANLLIQDQDPSDAFGFSVDRLNEQLEAGYAKLQPGGGLIMHVPDLGTSGQPTPKKIFFSRRHVHASQSS